MEKQVHRMNEAEAGSYLNCRSSGMGSSSARSTIVTPLNPTVRVLSQSAIGEEYQGWAPAT